MAKYGISNIVSDLDEDRILALDGHVSRLLEKHNTVEIEQVIIDASNHINRVLEYDWYPTYARKTGRVLYSKDANGKSVTSYDPANLVKDHPLLQDIHAYYTLYLIYRAASSSLTSPNVALQKLQNDWLQDYEIWNRRLLAVSDFYDENSDGSVDKNEELYAPKAHNLSVLRYLDNHG